MSAPVSGMPVAVPLYGFQRRWFLDRRRFKIGMFARQTGKTFTTTLEIVDDCFAAYAAGTSRRWVILSRGERQAKEAMDEGVKVHARAYNLGFQEWSDTWRSEETGTSYRALEVELPGGSRITALPANPDTARGFSANVFLDEFAFHRDSRAIWKALFPVISKPGLKLRIVSTPNGKSNKFYELMTGRDERWGRYTTDIHQAVADGLERDIDELREALDDDDGWAQEYEIQWLDEASAWLTYELITDCEDESAGDPSLYSGGPCFIGNDIGRRRDLWCAWVVEAVGDVLWTREVITRKNASFAEQAGILKDLFDRYRVARIGMDQTGMGEKPVEDAKRSHGEHRVEGVLFTPAHKLALAVTLKQAMEDRKLRLPMGDSAMRADLHKPKKVVGPTGIPRFIAEADSNGHADRFWALALAAAAADLGAYEYGYTPARMGGGNDAAAGLIDPREVALGRARGRFGGGAY